MNIKRLIGEYIRLTYRLLPLFVVAAILLLGTTAHAQTAPSSLISADSSGNITFTPSYLTTELITIVATAIAAAAGLFFAWMGTRWIYRIVKGTK